MTVKELEHMMFESLYEAVAICKVKCHSDNPIEVWTYCEGLLDAAVRRKIAEKLKESCRNPFTGKIEWGKSNERNPTV